MTQLVITGAENITIDEKHITKMGYRIVTPEDSNARSTDVSKILWIEGRIIPEIAEVVLHIVSLIIPCLLIMNWLLVLLPVII